MSTIGKVLAWIALTPIAVLVVGIGGCEARKAYYDWQVREMCEKDGGVKVFEKIIVSPDEQSRLPKIGGYWGVAPEALAKGGEPAFSRTRNVYLREGDLSIVRYEEEIVRRSDGRIVARSISYGRGGGDFLAPHPSSFSCPDATLRYAGIHTVYQTEEMKQ